MRKNASVPGVRGGIQRNQLIVGRALGAGGARASGRGLDLGRMAAQIDHHDRVPEDRSF